MTRNIQLILPEHSISVRVRIYRYRDILVQDRFKVTSKPVAKGVRLDCELQSAELTKVVLPSSRRLRMGENENRFDI